MLNNGTITREMHDAGAIFRRQFRAAALDTLRAMPLIRIPGARSVDTTTEQQFQAREKVAAAIDALGGPASPAGACVWHVVGLESSTPNGHGGPAGADGRSGTRRDRAVSALGALAGHYGLVGRRAA